MQSSYPFILPDKLSSFLKGSQAADPRAVHCVAFKLGCIHSSIFLSNNILHAYGSSSVTYAHQLFNEIPHPNAVTWSIMNSTYSHMCRIKDIILLFGRMLSLRISPNNFVFGSIFTGCTHGRDLQTGIQIHGSALKIGFTQHTFVAGTMIDMYARCGKVEESWRIFYETAEKDVVTWTTMFTCLANCYPHECPVSVFRLFREMISGGIWPVGMTFVSVFKVFDEPDKLRQATQVHGCMIKLDIELDTPLGSALIAMYGRCGEMREAVIVFDRIDHDAVSRTSLLVAYMQNAYYKNAILLFKKMIEEKMEIDPFVVTCMIGVLSALEDIGKGKEVHAYVIRNNFFSDVSVGNSLITLYGRCRETKMAEKLFQLMNFRDVISWTAMMTCYSQNELGRETFLLFLHILREGQSPPIFCITSAIRACSTLSSLPSGEQLHGRIVKMGLDASLFVANSLITMYAKCGSINSAFTFFNYLNERDIVSWNAMIMGFSQHGFVKKALYLFSEMQKSGIKPDEFTFIGILASFSRVGLVAAGWEYFNMMTEHYGLEHRMEHYGCMVDLLGRSNKLSEALDFIYAMPVEPDNIVWETLLASCKVHGDAELVKCIAKRILEMKPEDASPYITFSTIDTFTGIWDGKTFIRDKVKSQGLSKEPGKSWVDTHISS
ncbi:pentatricopeptide repeat-containing protein At4g13650-like [Phalaenopsis equestris]|uniref:pentatricopeptide repeat-containing protein At4g13650-like n=1 Tax=Phalaenopsis equestris TaxID=78828 RepID=UPI0009E38977|nr:pentatricopeptide repeat-containing protein At4g13650-like [Phalaenopsis equestris]